MESLVPDLAPEGVVSESVDVLGEPIGIKYFHHLDNSRVEYPLTAGDTRVGDLVGQSVLERILALGRGDGLVKEFGGLQLA
jgi:hypothetical protein